MRRTTAILLLIFFLQSFLSAQEYKWNVAFDYFFDNTEYSKSSFFDSETMQGIWLKPVGGISWDEKHTIYAGINLLKLPGTGEVVDKADLTAYYEYKTEKVIFKAGAFPRRETLGNYNNFFFKDSVNHFLPVMRGVFWQFGNDKSFFNAWMDWTSYATPSTREKFFIGLSGKVTKGILFGDFQSYMFHNANTRPRSEADPGVRENMQLQASLGLEYSNGSSFEGLLSAGVLMGYERDRFREELHKPIGFTARANAEYWGIGTQNTFYVGDPRMQLFERFGGDLYWGTQFLRGKSYVKSEWYIRLLESDRAKVRFNLNMHFSEGNMLFQQMFTVSANLGNHNIQSKGKGPFPWMRIFQ